MRKIIFIAFTVLIVVVIGGFSVSWFLQASEIKRNVEAAIARVNATQQYITYQSIETSGFPSDVSVSIVNPRFAGRIDTLLKEMGQAKPGAVLTDAEKQELERFSQLPEWSEDITLNGAITLSVNALSDAYTLSLQGDWTGNGKIGTQAIAMESLGDNTSCRLEMARGTLFTTLWDFDALTRDPARLAPDFRLLDCVAPTATITDRNTKEALVKSGGARVYITSAPEGDQRQVRFHLKVTDSEVTAAGDPLYETYFNIVRVFDPFFYYPKLSSMGKQNIEVDFSYNGPADMKKDFQSANFDVRLDKFIMNNNLSNSSGTLVFIKTPDAAGNQSGKAGYRFESVIGAQYDAYLRDYARFMVNQAYANGSVNVPGPLLAEFQPTMEKYTADEMYAIIYPAIPNFQYLGKIVQGIDIGYQLDKTLASGDVTLTSLDFSATPYGVTGQGTLKQTQGQLFPTSNIRFSCRNCLVMVDDIFAYAARLKAVLAYFKPEEAAEMLLPPELVQGTKDFLDRLSEKNPADLTTLNYTVVSDPAAGVSINGKNIMEVMGLYGELIAPWVAQPKEAPATN